MTKSLGLENEFKGKFERRAMVWGMATKKKRPGAMVWIVLRREALI